MRRLLTFIWIVVGLVAMVTGCHRAPRYDSRLMAADSLMRSNPDSALAIINAVIPDSLATEGDRAYHDLLLTQARYRCYITATSDSAINRALGYYRLHSNEREKLTRAFIYKGAVMEELGHPDSAMFYYKHAEYAADTSDYFNLGYVKMMIGDLYTYHYSMDGKAIEKYEEGIICITQTNDTDFLYLITNNLGCLYRETNPLKADSLLMVASELALRLDNQQYIAFNAYSRIVLYFDQQRYDQARNLISDLVLADSLKKELGYNFFFNCANVYARCGLMDSAYHFFNLGQQYRLNDEQYRMCYLGCLSELALMKNDSVSYLRYNEESNVIADSLKSNALKLNILKTESQFDKDMATHHVKTHETTTITLIILFVILAASAVIYSYRRKHRYDHLIEDINNEHNSKAGYISKLEQNIKDLKINDQNLRDFITAHTVLMRDVIDACYHEPQNKLADKVKKIVKYQENNKDMWIRLYDYIDIEYNGIMKHTIKDYPQLNERELLLIALTCLGYSYVEIAIIMGYTNATTISGNKQRVAKKMNLGCSINDYIKKYNVNFEY